MSSTKMTCWELPFPPDGKLSFDNPSFLSPLLYFALIVNVCWFTFSGKPPTARPKLTMRAALGRGRGVRFSPATAPGTPVVPVCGTL